jgi:death on curing protein
VTEPIWIDERDALAIHARLLALDGGAHGPRDAGLLSSALARPPQHFADAHETDLVQLAALYTKAIVRNHPSPTGTSVSAS